MNPILGPIVLLALPLLAGVAVYLVRRWTVLAAFLSVATAGALALLCALLPLDRSAYVLGREVAFGRPVVILGRNLILDPAGQVWLAFVFALAAVLFLVAWRLPQGRSFFPITLVILSLYSLVVLLQSAALAVIVFGISATVAVSIIQGGQLGSIRGAQRYLVVTLLAVPLMLAAVWLIDQSLLDGSSANLARSALLPAALGFGLLLAAFPFGTWMPALAADAPPLVTGFVFTAGQTMALFLALLFLRDTPLTLSDPFTQTVFQFAGLVMAVLGGIMASAQRDFGRLFGYAALSDLGFLLLALGLGTSQGLTLALLHLANRAATILLLAVALAVLRRQTDTDRFSKLQGVARRLPIATTALLIGSLSLAGFPFTSGFATHWAVHRMVWNLVQPLAASATDAAPGSQLTPVLLVVALLVSMVGIVVGTLRGLSAMLGESQRQDWPRQPRIASFMLLGLISLVIILSLYPQLFLEPVQTVVQTFALF